VRVLHEYLSGRMGYVEIGGSRSCVRNIKKGCVQGSILGPILFNIYMSELENIVYPCKVVSYADDAYIIGAGTDEETVQSLLCLTLKNHFEWLDTIGMKCNLSKTEFIVIGVPSMNLVVNNIEIQSVKSMKMLGIYVDASLKWDTLIEKQVAKCRSYIFTLRYLRKHLSEKETLTIVKSHIISRLTYACPAWSHSLGFNLRAKLRSVYYRVIRVVLRDFDFKLNRTGLLRVSGLESIDQILFMRSTVFLFNLIQSLQPTELALRILSKIYTNERTPGRLTLFDTSRTRVGTMCITNSAKNLVDQWNFDWLELSTQTFKSSLRAHYIQQ